jgi:hypothetical protein
MTREDVPLYFHAWGLAASTLHSRQLLGALIWTAFGANVGSGLSYILLPISIAPAVQAVEVGST